MTFLIPFQGGNQVSDQGTVVVSMGGGGGGGLVPMSPPHKKIIFFFFFQPRIKVYHVPPKIYFDMWKGHSLEVRCSNIQWKIFIK